MPTNAHECLRIPSDYQCECPTNALAIEAPRESVTQPLHPEKETPAEYATRLCGICQYINANYNVENLCWELPERLQKLIDRAGDRIGK